MEEVPLIQPRRRPDRYGPRLQGPYGAGRQREREDVTDGARRHQKALYSKLILKPPVSL